MYTQTIKKMYVCYGRASPSNFQRKFLKQTSGNQKKYADRGPKF